MGAMSASDQMPAHDLDTEAAIVAASILDGAPSVELFVAAGVRGEHFFSPAHRHTFEACRDLCQAGGPVDLVLVKGWLHDRARLREVGGIDGLSKILDASPDLDPETLRAYAGRLVALAQGRRLRAGLLRVQALLSAPEGDITARLAEVRGELAELGGLTETTGRSFPVKTMGDVPKTPPPAAWVSERLGLGPGRPACLVGYSGSFKSWLIYDLAVAVAAPEGSGLGETCWGGLPIDRHGEVLIIDLEMGEDMVEERLALLAAGRWSEPAAWGNRLAYTSFPRWSLKMQGAEEALSSALRGKTLAVIDSLVMMLAGGDENDNGRAAELMGLLARVSRATGCTILVLHHEGKSPADGPKAVNQRGRGASSIQGMWSTQWAVTAHEGGRLVLEQGKVQRGSLRPSWSCQIADVCDEEGHKVGVRLAPLPGGTEAIDEEAPAPGAPVSPGLRAAMARVLDALRAEGKVNRKSLDAALKGGKSELKNKAISLLVERGQAVRVHLDGCAWFAVAGSPEADELVRLEAEGRGKGRGGERHPVSPLSPLPRGETSEGRSGR